ncbi:hypothetical protein [Tenacibaculum sp. IB213877]|uniref:hypothetical protein n=1 Tax=Tenacibaculum sp. IB213877 TaxID=3097351 RepID=UPI002A5A3C88|nr:hypothetical protein [Tenacibaculum sp. IB213877]MDY0779177.1 hypothetical protein [Tenacibaculum sp. IB213877]
MKKIFLILIFALSISPLTSQNKELITITNITPPPPPLIEYDWKQMIGFGCSSNGSLTALVKNYNLLLIKKKYKRICKNLKSNNKGKQFMSVLICDELTKRKLIKLSINQINLINKIKNSDKIVPVCSGCTSPEEVPLKVLLDTTNLHPIRERANSWLKNNSELWFKPRF